MDNFHKPLLTHRDEVTPAGGHGNVLRATE